MKKIDVLTEFQLKDIAADIQWRREKREQKKERGGRETTEEGKGDGGSQEVR